MSLNHDYYGDEFLQDLYESALLALGGQRLLDDAHEQAAAFADERYPWDGQGEEPPSRTTAYLAVLRRRVEIARSGLPPRRPGDHHTQPWDEI